MRPVLLSAKKPLGVPFGISTSSRPAAAAAKTGRLRCNLLLELPMRKVDNYMAINI